MCLLPLENSCFQPGKHTQNFDFSGCTCAAASSMCWESNISRIKHIQQEQHSKTGIFANPAVPKHEEQPAREILSLAQSRQVVRLETGPCEVFVVQEDELRGTGNERSEFKLVLLTCS